MGDATESRTAITALLGEAAGGGRAAFDALFPLVYDELRHLAHRQLAAHKRYTLDTTGLVHEAYLKLVDETSVPLKNRAYFFGAAARAMRQVLVDAARRRNRIKRGGGEANETLDETSLAVEGFAAEITELDESLKRLAEHFPRQADVVECRFFGGLSIDETAAALDTSRRTVVRDWTMARAWLYRELRTGQNA